MSFRSTLSQMWFNIQYKLFPLLEQQVGELSDEYKELASIFELIRIENFISYIPFANGRPPKDRIRIARAFVAKIVLKLTYTKQIIERLNMDTQLKVICGWEPHSKIPHKSKFSRVFNEFAESSLPEIVHQALIKEVYKDKIIEHIANDSTSLLAREQALKKEGTRKDRKKACNKRYSEEKKGKILSRRKKQINQSIPEMLAELPKSCDIGMKMNSQRVALVWKGFKLHVAIADMEIPISAILTSASVNDCEVAIPLMAKSNKVVTNFYDLMDSAYDVSEVKEYSASVGHVPIIDFHARSKDQKEQKNDEKKRRKILNHLSAEDMRYKKRFPKERFNALFKEYYGGKTIQYKGFSKVFCHAMFGILTYTAKTLLSLSS